MMWFATMNVNKGGVYKGEIIRNLLENFPCAVIGLQEVNINPFSHVSFADERRAFGFNCLLGAFDSDANVYRMAIISKLPLRQVTLPDVTCATLLGWLRSSRLLVWKRCCLVPSMDTQTVLIVPMTWFAR